jgi:hypothetical protein
VVAGRIHIRRVRVSTLGWLDAKQATLGRNNGGEPLLARVPALPVLRCGSQNVRIGIAAGVFLVLAVLVPAILVLGLFVWAAKKDGEEDRAVQGRLGISRRTRLGR